MFAICREDRAFLCRTCDISIHSANEHVSKHERFLLTGITVDLHPMSASGSSANAAAASVSAAEMNYQGEIQQQQDAAVPHAAYAAAAAAKKAKGAKRKAAQEESFNSADFHVPTYDAASVVTDNQYDAYTSGQFSEFVSDFLGPVSKDSKGDVSMANFLDGFFDDIDVSQDDFGVVPDMSVVR